MLRYITEMPPEDCSRDRGYSLPFHSDMVFQFHNKKINEKFFSRDAESSIQMESDVKSKYGSNQMVEVFMTPTSESSDNLIYDEAEDDEEQVTDKNFDIDAENGDTKMNKRNSFNGVGDKN